MSSLSLFRWTNSLMWLFILASWLCDLRTAVDIYIFEAASLIIRTIRFLLSRSQKSNVVALKTMQYRIYL